MRRREGGLLASGLRQDTLLVVVSKGFGGAVTLLLNIYAARNLPPDQFGIFAFCTANLQLFDALAGAALDMSVLKLAPAERHDGFKGFTPTERAALILKTGLGLLVLIILTLAGEALGLAAFRGPGGRPIFAMVGLSVLGILWFRSLQVDSQVGLQFRRFAAAELVMTVLRIVLVVGLIEGGHTGPTALVGAFGLAPAMAILAFLPLVLRDERSPAPWFDSKTCLKALRESGTLALIAGFSLAVFSQDLFFAAFLCGPAEVGILRASYTLAFIPQLLGSYLSQVLAPRIVPAVRAGHFLALYRKLQGWMILAAIVVLVGGMLLVDPVVHALFPAAYQDSIGVTQILLPAGAAGLVHCALSLSFLIFYRPKMFLVTDAVLAPCMAAAYYLLGREGGVVAIAWVTCIARVFKAVIAETYALRLLRRMESEAGTTGRARG